MTPNLAASLYLVSGVLFILALRRLSSPESSRQGNLFGILGMIVAIVVTFFSVNILFTSFVFILCALVIGGSIGTIIAYRISMTAMPQLVAGFHSLVGLAAVLVALSAFYNPEAFDLGTFSNIFFHFLLAFTRCFCTLIPRTNIAISVIEIDDLEKAINTIGTLDTPVLKQSNIISIIEDECKDEIEYFGYNLPKYMFNMGQHTFFSCLWENTL